VFFSCLGSWIEGARCSKSSFLGLEYFVAFVLRVETMFPECGVLPSSILQIL